MKYKNRGSVPRLGKVASFRASLAVNRDMQPESMHSRTSAARTEEGSISLRTKVFLVQMVAHLSSGLISALCVSISTTSSFATVYDA